MLAPLVLDPLARVAPTAEIGIDHAQADRRLARGESSLNGEDELEQGLVAAVHDHQIERRVAQKRSENETPA